MAFKKLNKSAVKLATDDLITEAFQDYCDHLRGGWTKGSWSFHKNGKAICTHDTMDRYLEDRPDVCDSQQYKIAVAQGYKRWERVVNDSADGTNRKANTASLQMLMRNKFGWDAKNSEDGNKEALSNLLKFAESFATARASLPQTKLRHPGSDGSLEGTPGDHTDSQQSIEQSPEETR